MKADLLMLQKALAAGPKSLGELRRKHDLDPSVVLRLVHAYPDKFSETETVEDRRMHAAVEAVTELSATECAFVKAVRGAGARGASESSLHRSLKLSARALAELADKFDLVWTSRREGKIWFFWRPAKAAQDASLGPPAVQIPESDQTRQERQPGAAVEALGAAQSTQNESESGKTDPELEAARDRLMAFLGDGSMREMGFLVAYTALAEATVCEIIQRWPSLFRVEEVNLSNTPHYAYLKIGLAREEALSVPVEPTPSLQPALAELVDPEELEIMKFKPGAPGMAYRRNDPRGTRGGRYRIRRPLVEI